MPGEVELTIFDSEDGQQIKSPETEKTIDGNAINVNKETTSSKANLVDDSFNDLSEQIQLQIQRQSTHRKILQYRYSNPLTGDGSSELASSDPSELARSRWRTAINLVISKNQRIQLNGVKQGEWDTTSDSDSPEPMPIDIQLFDEIEKMKET